MEAGGFDLKDIEGLVSSLSAEDINQLTEMAAQLFSAEKKGEQKEEKKAEKKPAGDFFSDIDMGTMMKLVQVFSKLNTGENDPGCDLLAALKPLLGREKKEKADQAMKMLRLASLLPLLKDL